MRVARFEEHASVLAHWWREGIRSRTVICLDAHLDLQRVSDRRMTRLAACTSAQQMEALSRPHPLHPGARYGFGIEDFLYPAKALGLIDRLIWVPPPHVGKDFSPEIFDRICQMDGVRPEELDRFARGPSGCVEGRLLGLDVTLCPLPRLADLELPHDGLIDIDIDYFLSLPEDEAWIGPDEVFESLRALAVEPPFVTISRSVESGFMPLRYRFLADHLAALWEGRTEDAAHFSRLFHLERTLRANGRASTWDDALKEQGRFPDCAATCHLLGRTAPDPAQAESWRRRAVTLDEAYRPSVLRSAGAIRNRQIAVELADVIALERQIDEHSRDDEERGLASLAVGLLYAAFGEVGRAIDCHRRAEPLGWGAELGLEIARGLAQAGDVASSLVYLERASEDDRSRTAAHYTLGCIYEAGGVPDRARAHLEIASDAAPAWVELLELRADVERRLGEIERERAVRSRAEQLRALGRELARRFA